MIFRLRATDGFNIAASVNAVEVEVSMANWRLVLVPTDCYASSGINLHIAEMTIMMPGTTSEKPHLSRPACSTSMFTSTFSESANIDF